MLMTCPWGRGKTDLKGVKLSAGEREWLGKQIVGKKISVANLSERFNLDSRRLHEWKNTVLSGAQFQESQGRPWKLSEDQQIGLVDELTDATYKMPTAEFNKKVLDLAKENAVNMNQAGEQATVSRRTMGRIQEALGVKTGNAEKTTNARAAAVADIRHAITFGAMNQLMQPLTVPELNLNADATAMTCGYDGAELAQVKFVRTENDTNKPLKVKPTQGVNNSFVKYTVKMYLTIGAASIAGDPVYIIQSEGMDADICEAHSVVGLGLGTDIEALGHVVFYKNWKRKRACPADQSVGMWIISGNRRCD
jgi:hypothetical protein